MKIKFPTHLSVTGHEIDTHTMSASTKEKIALLAEKLSLYDESMHPYRRIIGIAGKSGAGKTLTSVVLATMLRESCPTLHTEAVTIDGYHYTNDELDKRGLREVKGRYDTYDMDALTEDLQKFYAGDTVSFSTYSRVTHEPMHNVILFEPQERGLLILEGLWLLYDAHGWGDVRKHLDYSYYIDGDDDELRERTILRHMRGGRGSDDARSFYEASDSKNNVLVNHTKKYADEIIMFE